MPNQNCPVCGNRDHVYQTGEDPRYGDFVLCSLHGIQVCERVPKAGCLDGGKWKKVPTTELTV